MIMIEYDDWAADPTPETMAGIMDSLAPAINSEVQRFSGPKTVLRAKARVLAVKAIKSYNPNAGTQLRSWVTTNLQPLSRYSQHMSPMRQPEVGIRQAAELNRLRDEMSDELGREPNDGELADTTGISVKRIKYLREKIKPVIAESVMSAPDAESSSISTPAVTEANRLDMAKDLVYDSLNTRDKSIFDLKTGTNGKSVLPNHEIARRLGVSAAFISQRSRLIATQIQDAVSRGLV